MSELRIRRHFTRTIDIDGVAVTVQIRRMTPAEWGAFSKQLYRVDDPETVRLVTMRKPGEEQEKQLVPRQLTTWERLLLASVASFKARFVQESTLLAPDLVEAAKGLLDAAELCALSKHQAERWMIPDEEIRRRRLAEMTPEERAAFNELDAREDREAQAFLEEAFGYVTFPGRQMVVEGDEDGPELVIADGATFLQYFGARRDLVRQITALVHNCNTLSQSEKNASRSQSGSQPFSAEPEKAAPGLTPRTTAAGAVPPGSVGIEDATGAIAGSLSG